MKDIKEVVNPSLHEFKKYAEAATIIPVYREILADLETPVSMFLKLADSSDDAFLLESVEGGERWARYSFISWKPKAIFRSIGDKFSYTKPSEPYKYGNTTDPLVELKQIMQAFVPAEIPGLPRFWGGAVGFFSYDMVRFFEHLPNKPKDDLGMPDCHFMISDKIVIFDHLSHTVKIVACAFVSKDSDINKAFSKAVNEIDAIISLIKKPLVARSKRKASSGPVKSNMRERDYCAMINRSKNNIRAGDIIQAVLSQRFSKKTGASAFDIYRSLRHINPSPYMYFIKAGDFCIIGSSPEILVRKEDSLAETRPIAGTKPRGKDALEEEMLSKELMSDPKERAEHIMLVDLGRNDLARVCLPASVKVPNLMYIEKYSHVMHMVSSVSGILKPGIDAYDLFRACFPAGTVSGAPKVRAMEIIDELEPTARGTYAGSVGYFSFSGNMDMAITIRTILLKNGTAYMQAGAGIVADSKPKNEYIESKNKAMALFTALKHAEEGIN